MNHKPPERIYLQWDDESQAPHFEITWASEKINDDDVEYVRVTEISGGLLPCPFCGREATETDFNIRCTNDACGLRYGSRFTDPNEWNRRGPTRKGEP